MFNGIAPPDPYRLSVAPGAYRYTGNCTLRSQTINTSLKTLILMTDGQSVLASSAPTLFTPTNSTVVDQFNIYDGAIYNIPGPLLGTDGKVDGSFFGNMGVRVADKFVTAGTFDRVVLVGMAVSSTGAALHVPGAQYGDRVGVAMQRLAARGISPATTGVTFALIFGDGEDDNINGTSQASWTASFNSYKAGAIASGFSGRFFVPQESWQNGATSAAVRAAQAAVVDNITVFSGGDLDTLTGATNRQSGGTDAHMTDTGAASGATLVYNAMHATGAPY